MRCFVLGVQEVGAAAAVAAVEAAAKEVTEMAESPISIKRSIDTIT